jgi:hypothetical protein
VKNAKRQHVLRGDYLRKLLIDALKKGKDGRCIVRFEEAGLEADITLRLVQRE